MPAPDAQHLVSYEGSSGLSEGVHMAATGGGGELEVLPKDYHSSKGHLKNGKKNKRGILACLGLAEQ